MGGFLDLPLQMREVPHGRIQAILTKYRTEDGAACKSQIEENIRLYAGMVRVRIKENGDVLREARAAVERPIKETKKPAKVSPEVRRQELRSVIERVETLHEELVRVAQPYMEVPAAKRERGADALVMPMDEEGQKAAEDSGGRKKRVAESPPPREQEMPLQRRKLGSPEEISPPITQEAVRARLAVCEDETRRALRDVRLPGQGRMLRLSAAMWRRNEAMLGEARDFLREGGAAQNSQELSEQIQTLEILQGELRKIITSDSGGVFPHHVTQSVASLGSSEQWVGAAVGPRFGDLRLIDERRKIEEREKAREEVVNEHKLVYERVIVPAQRSLQKEAHEAQSEEGRSIRRFGAVSAVVATAGAFVVQDAAHIVVAAASEATFIERAAATAGALSSLHPATQIVAGLALSAAVAPRWSVKQTVLGVAVGIGVGIAFGPGVGFAAGNAAGEYGPGIASGTRDAVAGIVNPVLRRYAERRLRAQLKRREEEREALLPHGPHSPRPPEQHGGDKMDTA